MASLPVGSSILLSLMTLLRNAAELKLKEWRKKSHQKLIKIVFLMTGILILLLRKPLLQNTPYNAAEEQNVLQQEALTSGQDPVTSSEGKNCVLDDKQSHSAATKASRPEYDAAEVQNVLQQEALTSGHDPVTSSEGDLISDGDDVQASGQHQIVVSEDCPEECKRDKVKRSVQDEAVKSDGSHVLYSWEFQPAVSEISPLKTDTADMQKATQEESSQSGYSRSG